MLIGISGRIEGWAIFILLFCIAKLLINVILSFIFKWLKYKVLVIHEGFLPRQAPKLSPSQKSRVSAAHSAFTTSELPEAPRVGLCPHTTAGGLRSSTQLSVPKVLDSSLHKTMVWLSEDEATV